MAKKQNTSEYFHLEVQVGYDQIPVSFFKPYGEVKYDPTIKLTREQADRLCDQLKEDYKQCVFYVVQNRDR